MNAVWLTFMMAFHRALSLSLSMYLELSLSLSLNVPGALSLSLSMYLELFTFFLLLLLKSRHSADEDVQNTGRTERQCHHSYAPTQHERANITHAC